MKTWIENELKGCEFPDVRLGKRFKTIVEQLATGIGRSLPFACQDWANTKAVYRFLDNPRISEAEILKGHCQATCERFTASPGTILVLHDTTEFTFRRKHTEAIGKKLGGYLDRSHDPPSGNMVVWRGFRRLTDIHLGFNLANSCG